MKYTESDIGRVIDIDGDKGSYYEERIVMAYCQVCGARYIGPLQAPSLTGISG